MARAMKIFSLMAICVIMVAQQVAAIEEVAGAPSHGPKGPELIKFLCSMSPKKDLCLKVLFSDPSELAGAGLTDLAVVALRAASLDASSMLDDVTRFIDDPDMSPAIQQGLSDCKENVLDAGMQLDDAVASLLQGADRDAHTWLRAAYAAIDTCDASIPGDDDILSVKSRQLRTLVDLATAITNFLPNKNFQN
ncbi:hypothetical protein HN51_014942 [Arachis hypogaea]|uniref:Pectinesterase inhibitor domain-containing protein n=2 Tax=Arachis TaxID=3817 RepID=A0A445CML0_ARAHY|nr:uncharacterized protein LOC107492430 [Arachis duranensis]XP_025604043.1 uncharacterized protein LOC112695784 [Arachis hypogaea]QHO45026.1 Putative invertase inhibitor [Arachis hypogaea]RYR52138.1 hypothetical protein Ahy_A06g027055 [Arachis hypogaea]